MDGSGCELDSLTESASPGGLSLCTFHFLTLFLNMKSILLNFCNWTCSFCIDFVKCVCQILRNNIFGYYLSGDFNVLRRQICGE